MNWTGIIVRFLFFLTPLPLTAQKLIFKTYTSEDGLVSNPVLRIFQDSRGFMWIGTHEGLSKYDGHKFTNYNNANGLSYNMVNDIYESTDGKIYVTLNNGSVDIIQRDAIAKKEAFRNVVINQFYLTKDQRLIAATDTSGLYELKKGNLVKPSQAFPRSTYYDLTELNDSLFIAGSMGTLHILSRQFELFSELKIPPYLQIFKIFKDSRSRVWLGTDDGLKLVSFLQKNQQPYNFTLVPSPFKIPILRNRSVFDMLEDANGNFWIATSNGLVKIDAEGEGQVFSEKEGLPSSVVSILYLDKEKNLWIGTELGLAKIITKNNIRIYNIKNGLKSNLDGFLIPLKDDQFLTGTEAGIQLFNTTNEVFSPVRSKHNLQYLGFVKNSRPVLFFRNNSQFGTYDSVSRLIADHIITAPPNRPVQSSVMDSYGNIFTGTWSGLVIRSGNKFYVENKLPYFIMALLIDKKGFLWVGTRDYGLYRLNYTNTKIKSGVSNIQDFSHLLPDKSIRSMFEDSKGNIWIGTRYKGIVQLNNESQEPCAIQRFDLQQGLIRSIAEDSKGCIWVGSHLGIDKLIPAGKGFRVYNFSRENNFFGHISAILPLKDNSLWFATNKGLVNIIDAERENAFPQKVFITSVQLGDPTFNYSTHLANNKIKLKYFQNEAAFEFSAPSYINEKQILYSYRLIGSADTTWSEPANVHTVNYASLQPGKYQFEVRTIGWNDVWGIPSNFEFIIRPPYWQTWWFYTLVGLLILLSFYGIYLYRIRQLMTLQKVRNRIATDLHDDIGSTLTNISILSELSNKNLHQPEQAKKYLQRITEEVNASGQALDDIIWNVNSNHDTLEEMLVRMRRFAAELFDHTVTSCHLALQPYAAGKKLSMEQRRDVYLVYKETLNNIYKHAAAKTVWVDLSMIDHAVKLKIKDDGKGFNPDATTHRNGLNNLKTRVEKWKGKLIISSRPGKGSAIEIIIPVAT